METIEEYTNNELKSAVESLNNPLKPTVKNSKVYRAGTEALSDKIGSYTSGDLYRILEDSEASQQQLGFFSSAMEELGFVFEGDSSGLNREYGSPQNVWRNYRDEDFWESLRENLDDLYADEVEKTFSGR